LKPNLTWHDGTPASAEDWVFSHRVYSNPDLGAATTAPQGLIAEILAPDARTVVVRWKRPFPDADALDARALPALPRHILEEPLSRGDPDAFASNPYWTRDFVGIGPFRLVAWEPGAYINAEAFAGYLYGRPKIDRIHIVFIADQNTALANFLSGAIDIVFDNFMRYQTTSILEREWSRTNGGVVLRQLTGIRRSEVQLDQERANPQAIMDVRVRRAITHATDRDALNEGLIDGQGAPAHTVVFPHVDYFPEVDRVIAKHPFDLRRAEQLLNEVGYFKGSDGVFTQLAAGRFVLPMWTLNGTQNEAELAVHADMMRRFGLQVSEYVIPAAQVQDNQVRASFPGLANTSAGRVEQPVTQAIPRPENRWQGNNRGSWSNVEFDRIIETWNTTLARAERNALLVQAARIYSEEIPAIPLYYNVEVLPHVSALSGVIAPLIAYNAHLWELR
jgi:peptide/nickel transport system substrate-binding protein